MYIAGRGCKIYFIIYIETGWVCIESSAAICVNFEKPLATGHTMIYGTITLLHVWGNWYGCVYDRYTAVNKPSSV